MGRNDAGNEPGRLGLTWFDFSVVHFVRRVGMSQPLHELFAQLDSAVKDGSFPKAIGLAEKSAIRSHDLIPLPPSLIAPQSSSSNQMMWMHSK